MKILYSWLKDFVDLRQTPEKLADDLSMFAHEVESVEKYGDDTILDLEITPNRGDCLSVLGIARQVSAMYGIKYSNKSLECEIKEEDVDKKIEIKISDPKTCPRYTARIIDNITIGETPDFIKNRLKAYGFRSINNIVDITNYVMIITGQPLHAFDYSKISNGLMSLQLSKKGDEMTTLDGKNHVLPEGSIIISDNEKIYDLTGIMGGIKSEVDEETKTIVLQGAIFDPVLIRKTSKKLHHQTDASYRYERGVDPDGTVTAVDLAACLIKETSSQAKIGKLIDINHNAENAVISFNADKINNLIGTELTHNQIVSSLERLYFKIDGNAATVPSFRSYDITIWQDLAEEVARIYGYNNIERNIPKGGKSIAKPEWQSRESMKDALSDIGFSEVYSYSFADKDKIELTGFYINNCVEIINPMSPETQFLRPSLLPSILLAVAKNPWAPEVNIFEIEKVFDRNGEKWQLGIATTGKSDVLLNQAIDLLKIKARILDIDQNILDAYKIRRPVKLCIIDIDDSEKIYKDIDFSVTKNQYRKISKYAPTIRDLAFMIDDTIESPLIEKTILEASSAILLLEKFDEYVSPKIGRGKKSIAYHIWIQNMEGPVDDNDADNIVKIIISKIEDKFNAKLRS